MNAPLNFPGVTVSPFALLTSLGVMLGLILIARTPRQKTTQRNVAAGIYALAGALAGARIAYLVVHWPYYRYQPFEIPQFWQGGLSWPGALAGGWLALAIFAAICRAHPGKLADDLLPLFFSMAISSWLGCWLSGCAYGAEAQAWWTLPARDMAGMWSNRWPLQLIAALLVVAIFWGSEWVRDRAGVQSPGLAASLGMATLAIVLLGASFLRADPYPLWRAIRLETWAALVLLVLALLSGMLAFVRRHPR